MHAPAPKSNRPDAARASGLPWSSVVFALLAGVGGLALVSWVSTHFVI